MGGRAGMRVATATMAVALCGPALSVLAGGDPPAAFKRYFPKSRFPALDAPDYVTAAEADTPGDAWVLGVVVEGRALAYELNLLTRHEVVNDTIAERPVAIVWCPLANSVGVYDRRVGGRELEFEPSGVLMHGSIVFQDRETESFWPLLQERALYGPLEGRRLTRLPGAVKVRFDDWVRKHPDTLVWSLHGQEHLPRNPMMRYLASALGYDGLVARDGRLATKDLVFGFLREGKPYAAAAEGLAGGSVFDLPGGGQVFLYRPDGAALHPSTRAYSSADGFVRQGGAWLDRGTGARFDARRGSFAGDAVPPAVEGFDAFWYVWSLHYPDTVLLGR
jgi:hypothetical protein